MAAGGKGRAAFLHLSPEGFRIRLMEPGEAEALYELGLASGLFGAEAPDLHAFIRWLLGHEVFVAEAEAGGLSGFAAARDAVDLYWLAGLAVAPDVKGQGVRKALLGAVVTRAGWFFHRAVGLALSDGDDADWYRRRRFLRVEPAELAPALVLLATEAPGVPPRLPVPSDDEEDAFVGTERNIMIHWL